MRALNKLKGNPEKLLKHIEKTLNKLDIETVDAVSKICEKRLVEAGILEVEETD